MIAGLRFGLFVLLFAPWSALVFLAAALGELVRPGVVEPMARLWSRSFRLLARLTMGVRLKVRGQPPPRPALIAARHESLYEAVGMLDLLEHPAVVLKAELSAVPGWRFLGRRAGAMFVDRAAGPAVIRPMLRAARAAVAAGRSVLIFPEGTRIASGASAPLQPGIAALYEALRLPVAPVALDSGRVWPPERIAPRPGTIHLAFLPLIPPGLPRAEFMGRLSSALRENPA